MVQIDICGETIGNKLLSDCSSESNTFHVNGFEGSLDKEGKSSSAIEDLVKLDGRAHKSKEVSLPPSTMSSNGACHPLPTPQRYAQ